jgi:hypothetical protein
MEITSCSLDELLKLYYDAGQQDLAEVVIKFASGIETLTFRVTNDAEPQLLAAVAFCESGNDKTDLVVVGFATNKDIEKPSPTLEKFLARVLHMNSGTNFDLVSFTCLNPEDNALQLAPYLNGQSLGYRPVIHSFIVPSNGKKRIRLAHDAKAFKVMHS